MQFISYRELRNLTPSALSKELTNGGELVLILNNRPFAVMISVFYKLKGAQFIIEKVPILKEATLKLSSKRDPFYYVDSSPKCNFEGSQKR